MDGYLKQNLDTAKRVIKKDWDMVFVYDGYEGSGKSVKAMQDAYYCDPTFDLSRFAFSAEQFKQKIDNASQYHAIVYDEAYSGLSSRQAMTKINTGLVKKLATIRQKNLFIFVVMPTFFDLDKYVALWRSRALIHVYSKEEFARGYFAFFNIERKKKLYVGGKKYYNYGATKANFHGKFINYYPVDEKKYRYLKAKAEEDLSDEEEEKIFEARAKKWLFNKLVDTSLPIKNTHKHKLLEISEQTYYNWVNDYKKKLNYSKLSSPPIIRPNLTTKQGVVNG